MVVELRHKYVNAVSSELITGNGFSLLEVQTQGKPDFALIRKKGNILELIFFDTGNVVYTHVNDFIPGVTRYMEMVGCDRAKLIEVHVFEGEDVEYAYNYEYNPVNISVSEVWVNIFHGTIKGKEADDELIDTLTKFLDVDFLGGYSLHNLDKLQKQRDQKRPVPVVTYTLLLANFILWILMTLAGGSTDSDILIKFGAMYGPLVIKGEYWRFITPLFLHVGLVHLGFNSYALYQLGSLAETIYGKVKFIIIYLAAGISGSILSFMFTRAVSAGASGAIFGLLGALLYFGKKRPGVFKRGFTGNLVTIIGINLFIGFTYSGIDNFAHIGGLIGGYVSSFIVGAKRNWHLKVRQYLYMIAFAVLLISLAAAGIWMHREDDRVVYYKAREYVEKGEFGQADLLLEDLMDRLSEGDDVGIEARYLYAYSRARQGDINTAIRYCETVVKHHPDSYNANLFLGILYMDRGDKEKAVHYLERAFKIDPGSKEARDLLEHLRRN